MLHHMRCYLALFDLGMGLGEGGKFTLSLTFFVNIFRFLQAVDLQFYDFSSFSFIKKMKKIYTYHAECESRWFLIKSTQFLHIF